MAASNTVLQTLVDDDKRGRVMSIYTMCFMGLAPFGSIAAGWVSQNIGLGPTVVISGIISILLALIFATKLEGLRQQARQTYVERGIISAEVEMKVLNS